MSHLSLIRSFGGDIKDGAPMRGEIRMPNIKNPSGCLRYRLQNVQEIKKSD